MTDLEQETPQKTRSGNRRLRFWLMLAGIATVLTFTGFRLMPPDRSLAKVSRPVLSLKDFNTTAPESGYLFYPPTDTRGIFCQWATDTEAIVRERVSGDQWRFGRRRILPSPGNTPLAESPLITLAAKGYFHQVSPDGEILVYSNPEKQVKNSHELKYSFLPVRSALEAPDPSV